MRVASRGFDGEVREQRPRQFLEKSNASGVSDLSPWLERSVGRD